MDDDVVLRYEINALIGIAQKTNSCVAKTGIDMWVVDDLSGQKNGFVWKSATCLVCVIDRSIDSVTEPKLLGEVYGQSTC